MSRTLQGRRLAELRYRRRGSAPPQPSAPRARVAYLDNLKVLLVAVIIAAHGVAAYSDLESAWPYQDVQEVQVSAASNAALGLVVLPAVLFVMGLFFLVSGLVTRSSTAVDEPDGRDGASPAGRAPLGPLAPPTSNVHQTERSHEALIRTA